MPARKRYLTRRYHISGMNRLWQADLADMQPYASQNNGYKYILTVIDVFSRRGWAVGVKSKTVKDIAPAFREIFAQGIVPKQVQSDQGMEFESATMKRFFNEFGIDQYF